MPNYIVHFWPIEWPDIPEVVARRSLNDDGALQRESSISEPRPIIQSTTAEANGRNIFGFFRDAKAAAIRYTDEVAARLKERRAHIRGIQEKDLTLWEPPVEGGQSVGSEPRSQMHGQAGDTPHPPMDSDASGDPPAEG